MRRIGLKTSIPKTGTALLRGEGACSLYREISPPARKRRRSTLRDSFATMWHVPVAFVTGQTGKSVKALLNHAQMLFKQSLERVTTGQLKLQAAASLG